MECNARRGGAYVVAVAIVMLVLPTIDETPDDFPRRRPLRVPAVLAWHPVRPVGDHRGGVRFDGARLLGERRAAGGGHRADRAHVSEVVRLTLVSHAMTDAMSAGRFPTDEPLNSVGHRQVDASIELGVTDSAFCGPEKRTRQTAELLGLQASIEHRLADLDCGRWRGDVLGGVRPADLAIWLTDPARAPHGGESVVDLINRVRDWMDTLTTRRSRLVAVTHPAVVRAAILVALDAPPKSFWRIDIAPVSRTVMHFRGHAWNLRTTIDSGDGHQIEGLVHDRQQPGRRRLTAELRPVQLEADHIRLPGAVDGVPAERQVAGQVAALGADVRPLRAIEVDTGDGGQDLLHRRGRADRRSLQRRVHAADVGRGAVPLGADVRRRSVGAFRIRVVRAGIGLR